MINTIKDKLRWGDGTERKKFVCPYCFRETIYLQDNGEYYCVSRRLVDDGMMGALYCQIQGALTADIVAVLKVTREEDDGVRWALVFSLSNIYLSSDLLLVQIRSSSGGDPQEKMVRVISTHPETKSTRFELLLPEYVPPSNLRLLPHTAEEISWADISVLSYEHRFYPVDECGYIIKGTIPMGVVYEKISGA